MENNGPMVLYRTWEEKPFILKDFFDKLNSIGNIPISLGHWEMTGSNENLKLIIEPK